MQDNHKYLDYKIENFIYLIVEQKIQKQELVSKIKNTGASEELISEVLQKIDFAYKRINQPLENNIKYLLLLFPFGIVNVFNLNGFFDLEENIRLGFVKKVKEYRKYSFIGLTLYAVIILSAIFFFHVNKNT